MVFRYCLFLIFLGSFGVTGTAQSVKKLKEKAAAFIKHEKYQEALQPLLEVQYRQSNDLGTRLNIGICYYELNRLSDSQKYLKYVLDNDKSPDPKTFLYLGKLYHANLQFKDAVGFYKLFLKSTKKHPLAKSVKDDIRRCGRGLRLEVQERNAFVENMGDKVNSSYDDFGPVLSPNYDSKIYFTSSRPGNQGGLRNKEGRRDDTYGHYNTDMFATSVVNGEWTATTPLNPLINSPRHDMVLGFDRRGTMLYFFKGPSLFSGEVLVDTFQAKDERALNDDRFVSPMITENGDGYPHFFNDTVLIFSSYRKGGYGGSDLYISLMQNGRWMPAKNLGPRVNSAYDEITPFLATDGRTLYFSSNSAQGIGGFDIYRAAFDDVSEQWSTAENVGLPINSAGDDAYFKLSADGLKAYFSSSRKDGLGQQDLYVAYFKSQRNEQLSTSMPNTFAEVRSYKQQQSNSGYVLETPNTGQGTISTVPGAPQYREDEIIKYEINPIYYTPDDKVLIPSNLKELNKVARLLLDFPQLKLVMASHSDGSTPPAFDLYFSAKRAEQAAEYLIEQGVNAANITIVGCGASYPQALNELESGANELGQRLNRRIEFAIQNTAGLPLRITYAAPRISQYMVSPEGEYYRAAVKGLSYKVQIAAIGQMYNGDLVTRYPDAMAEHRSRTNLYQYTVGLYQTYASAEQLVQDLKRQGITDAFVVPYINGMRVSRDDTKVYAAAYPDLLNFLRFSDQD